MTRLHAAVAAALLVVLYLLGGAFAVMALTAESSQGEPALAMFFSLRRAVFWLALGVCVAGAAIVHATLARRLE